MLAFRLHVLALTLLLVCFMGAAAPLLAEPPRDACNQIEALVASLEQSIDTKALGQARVMADALDPGACPLVAARLGRAKVSLAKAEQKARQTVALAILACDRDKISAARQSLVAVGLTLKAETAAGLAAVTKALDRTRALRTTAVRHLKEGDAAAAERALDSARRVMATVSQHAACSREKQRLTEIRSRVAALREARTRTEEIAGSCNLSAVTGRLAQLRSREMLSPAERSILTRLARLETELKRVALARKLAERRQDRQEFARAAALLTRADEIITAGPASGGCESERRNLAREIALLQSLAEARAGAKRALATCDLPALRQARARLLRTEHPQLAALRHDVERATGMALALTAAHRSAEDGHYDRARASLDRLDTTEGAVESGLCPDVIEQGQKLRGRLKSAEKALITLGEVRQTCDPERLATTLKADWPADPPVQRRVRDLVALLTTLRQHAGAIRKAKEAVWTAADAATAKSVLTDLETRLPTLPAEPSCDARRAAAAKSKQELVRLVAAVERAETRLRQSCKADDLSAVEGILTPFASARAPRRLLDIARSRAAITKRLLIDFQSAINKRDLDRALAHLDGAISGAARIPADFCAADNGSLHEELSAKRDHLDDVRAIVAGLASLGEACDVAAIDASIRTLKEAVPLHGFSNGAFDREIGRLQSLKQVCVARARRELRAAEMARCRGRLGPHGRAVEHSGSYHCDCAAPYRLDVWQAKCLKPRAMVEREAHADCKRRHGPGTHAVDIKDDGSHECRCNQGYAVVEGKAGCTKPTGWELEKVTGDWCRKTYGELAISVEVKRVDDYKCRCRNGARWNATRDRCYRPSRQELRQEAWADCRKTHGRRLVNVTMKKNGTWICHYRKTRRQLYRDALAACRRQHGRKVKGVRLNKAGTQYWCTF